MASDNEASCEGDPNFAVICGFLEKFGAACGLSAIDFIDLQEMLENTHEVVPELANLHIKLLRKIRKSVSTEKWERAVIKICHVYNSQDAWELERFGYKKSRIGSKLRILKQLLEMQFDLNIKFKNEINKMTAEQLRTQPLGKDKLGHAYWYQLDESCQIRVYKEDPDEESWALIAKDRQGLLSLITQLGSNDTIKVGSEPIVNEDSNSLEIEKPILDTGQNDSNSSSSKPSKKSSEDESTEDTDSKSIEKPTDDDKSNMSDSNSETPTKEAIIEEKINAPKHIGLRLKPLTELLSQSQQALLDNEKKPELSGIKEKYIRSDSFTSPTSHRKAVDSAGFDTAFRNDQKRSIDYDIEEPSIKRPRTARPTLLVNKKKPYSSDEDEFEEVDEEEEEEYDDEEDEDELGEEIEEPLMLVRGEGNGRDNNCGNLEDEKPEMDGIGEVIEDPVFYVFGVGSGVDCQAGPEKADAKESKDDSNKSEENSIKPNQDQSPTKSTFKLGTIVDLKVDRKEAFKSIPKKSRWDIKQTDSDNKSDENIKNYASSSDNLTVTNVKIDKMDENAASSDNSSPNVKILVDKFEMITKVDTEIVETPPKSKNTFFFGPGSAFSFKPPTPAVPNKSTFSFGTSQKEPESLQLKDNIIANKEIESLKLEDDKIANKETESLKLDDKIANTEQSKINKSETIQKIDAEIKNKPISKEIKTNIKEVEDVQTKNLDEKNAALSSIEIPEVKQHNLDTKLDQIESKYNQLEKDMTKCNTKSKKEVVLLGVKSNEKSIENLSRSDEKDMSKSNTKPNKEIVQLGVKSNEKSIANVSKSDEKDMSKSNTKSNKEIVRPVQIGIKSIEKNIDNSSKSDELPKTASIIPTKVNAPIKSIEEINVDKKRVLEKNASSNLATESAVQMKDNLKTIKDNTKTTKDNKKPESSKELLEPMKANTNVEQKLPECEKPEPIKVLEPTKCDLDLKKVGLKQSKIVNISKEESNQSEKVLELTKDMNIKDPMKVDPKQWDPDKIKDKSCEEPVAIVSRFGLKESEPVKDAILPKVDLKKDDVKSGKVEPKHSEPDKIIELSKVIHKPHEIREPVQIEPNQSNPDKINKPIMGEPKQLIADKPHKAVEPKPLNPVKIKEATEFVHKPHETICVKEAMTVELKPDEIKVELNPKETVKKTITVEPKPDKFKLNPDKTVNKTITVESKPDEVKVELDPHGTGKKPIPIEPKPDKIKVKINPHEAVKKPITVETKADKIKDEFNPHGTVKKPITVEPKPDEINVELNPHETVKKTITVEPKPDEIKVKLNPIESVKKPIPVEPKPDKITESTNLQLEPKTDKITETTKKSITVEPNQSKINQIKESTKVETAKESKQSETVKIAETKKVLQKLETLKESMTVEPKPDKIAEMTKKIITIEPNQSKIDKITESTNVQLKPYEKCNVKEPMTAVPEQLNTVEIIKPMSVDPVKEEIKHSDKIIHKSVNVKEPLKVEPKQSKITDKIEEIIVPKQSKPDKVTEKTKFAHKPHQVVNIKEAMMEPKPSRPDIIAVTTKVEHKSHEIITKDPMTGEAKQSKPDNTADTTKVQTVDDPKSETVKVIEKSKVFESVKKSVEPEHSNADKINKPVTVESKQLMKPDRSTVTTKFAQNQEAKITETKKVVQALKESMTLEPKPDKITETMKKIITVEPSQSKVDQITESTKKSITVEPNQSKVVNITELTKVETVKELKQSETVKITETKKVVQALKESMKVEPKPDKITETTKKTITIEPNQSKINKITESMKVETVKEPKQSETVKVTESKKVVQKHETLNESMTAEPIPDKITEKTKNPITVEPNQSKIDKTTESTKKSITVEPKQSKIDKITESTKVETVKEPKQLETVKIAETEKVVQKLETLEEPMSVEPKPDKITESTKKTITVEPNQSKIDQITGSTKKSIAVEPNQSKINKITESTKVESVKELKQSETKKVVKAVKESIPVEPKSDKITETMKKIITFEPNQSKIDKIAETKKVETVNEPTTVDPKHSEIIKITESTKVHKPHETVKAPVKVEPNQSKMDKIIETTKEVIQSKTDKIAESSKVEIDLKQSQTIQITETTKVVQKHEKVTLNESKTDKITESTKVVHETVNIKAPKPVKSQQSNLAKTTNVELKLDETISVKESTSVESEPPKPDKITEKVDSVQIMDLKKVEPKQSEPDKIILPTKDSLKSLEPVRIIEPNQSQLVNPPKVDVKPIESANKEPNPFAALTIADPKRALNIIEPVKVTSVKIIPKTDEIAKIEPVDQTPSELIKKLQVKSQNTSKIDETSTTPIKIKTKLSDDQNATASNKFVEKHTPTIESSETIIKINRAKEVKLVPLDAKKINESNKSKLTIEPECASNAKNLSDDSKTSSIKNIQKKDLSNREAILDLSKNENKSKAAKDLSVNTLGIKKDTIESCSKVELVLKKPDLKSTQSSQLFEKGSVFLNKKNTKTAEIDSFSSNKSTSSPVSQKLSSKVDVKQRNDAGKEDHNVKINDKSLDKPFTINEGTNKSITISKLPAQKSEAAINYKPDKSTQHATDLSINKSADKEINLCTKDRAHIMEIKRVKVDNIPEKLDTPKIFKGDEQSSKINVLDLTKPIEKDDTLNKIINKSGAIEITKVMKKPEQVIEKSDVNIEKLFANTSVTFNKVKPVEKSYKTGTPKNAVEIQLMTKKSSVNSPKLETTNMASKSKPVEIVIKDQAKSALEKLAGLVSSVEDLTPTNNRSLRSRGGSKHLELPETTIEIAKTDKSDSKKIKLSKQKIAMEKKVNLKEIEEQIISTKEDAVSSTKQEIKVNDKDEAQVKSVAKEKIAPKHKETNKPTISLRSSRRQKDQLDKKPAVIIEIANPKLADEPICIKEVAQPLTEDTEMKKVPLVIDLVDSPASIESVGDFGDPESDFDDMDIGQDPLASPESPEPVVEKIEKKLTTLTALSFDFVESPTPTQTPRGTRKRGRVSPIPEPVDHETPGKRRKTRAKRVADTELRKSVEEKKKKDLSSSEEEVKSPPTKSLKKGKGIKRLTISPIPASSNDNAVAEKPITIRKGTPKKKTLMGLDIPDNIDLTPPGVRQSRRIAQIKIKEAAERVKIDDFAIMDIIKPESSKKKKKENDKDYKSEKRKRNKTVPDSDEDSSSEDVESQQSDDKKKLKKKRKLKNPKFDESHPWKSSSDSADSDSHHEEEEEEEQEEPEYEAPKSDHEFSPESEDDEDYKPVKRARTVRKEDAAEEAVDDTNCQKCGKSDHPEWILLCDICDFGWHCSCLLPVLFVIPEGDWLCPPCQHESLIKKLQSQLEEFDKKVSKRTMEERRKERLAYVGISLDNVLPTKEHDEIKKHKQDSGKQSRSESSVSGSSSGSSSDSGDEPIYQLRQRRQAHSYRFNDYDDLINSAIQEEVEAVKGAGNEGRGKDIATIVNAGNEAEVEELPPVIPKDSDLPPVVPQNQNESDDDEDVIKPIKRVGRKKHRKLNALDDVSSDEGADSDEDFKGSEVDEDEEEFESDSDVSRRGGGIVRRSGRARVSRFDKEFINDDSEDDAPKKKKTRSVWDDSEESEESDASWGRRKKPTGVRRAPVISAKKRRPKKKSRDDSDVEVYKKKKPKIKYGGLESDDEEVGPRTRGKKITYVDALGTDSDDDIRRKNTIKDDESEDEFVLNEEDDVPDDEVERDSDDSNSTPLLLPKTATPIKAYVKKGKGKGGIKRIKRAQGEEEEALFPPLFPESDDNDELPSSVVAEASTTAIVAITSTNPPIKPELPPIPIPNTIEEMNKNIEEMGEKEMEMMMEEEEYANKQLQMVATQLEKEKRRREMEAKKLSIPPELQEPDMLPNPAAPSAVQVHISVATPPIVNKTPAKRGRKPKSELTSPETSTPTGGIAASIIPPMSGQMSPSHDEMSMHSMHSDMGGQIPTMLLSLDGTPKKRRGRGKGRKTLEKEAAASGSKTSALNISSTSSTSMASRDSNDSSDQPIPKTVESALSSNSKTSSPAESPLLGGKLGVAAAPQPFSQSQPMPSVITRMLQSQPGQASYPVGAMGHKFYEDRPDGPPPAGVGPQPGLPFMPNTGGPRGVLPGPPGLGYRPPMNHYPVVRSGPPPPHRLRSPGPPNIPPHMYHPHPSTHHTMEPSASSGGGPLPLVTDRSSPSLASPSAGSPLGSKTPPPQIYVRAPLVRFPPMPQRHPHMLPQHMQQQPRANVPYHTGMHPNFHYGQYSAPPPPNVSAEDSGPSPNQFAPQYSEQFSEGSSDGPKNYDEENGEFGGLVSYFSSQREDDDLDT